MKSPRIYRQRRADSAQTSSEPNLTTARTPRRHLPFGVAIRFLPVLALAVPIVLLYYQYAGSFEQLYQGRTFYLFFLWLAALEIILGWETLRNLKIGRARSWKRTLVFGLLLLIPTVYVIAASNFGLNQNLMDLAIKSNVGEHWASLIPLNVEFFVFAIVFSLIIVLQFGVAALKNFMTSILFLGIMGFIFVIDNLYPNGRFTPFQFFVQPTATLSADVFRLMGFQASMMTYSTPEVGTMPVLAITNSTGKITQFGIAWQCAGIESLLIYTITVSLFLSYTAMKRTHKIILFVIGALITYSLNIVRIVTIFLVDFNGGNYQTFHALYGPLISVTWVVCYPLIIIGIQMLSTRIRTGIR